MKKVKWGVLGTANIAKGCTIPGMLLAEHCELAAVAGRSLEKAQAYQKEFGFQKAYGSYEELLADPEIQAVYIPLPNSLHAEWAIRAMKAGKHVLSEKPMAPDAQTAERMIQASKENGVFLMEAFAYLHSPLMREIKQCIDSGRIGELCYMEAAFTTGSHDLSDIRMRRETYGGSVYDLGCYCTSLILWMFGREPEKVQAIAEYTPEGIDSVATGILTFSGGAKAVFNCGMCLAPGGGRLDRMIFHGNKGRIVTDAEYNQAGTLRYSLRTENGEEVKTVEAPQNYSLEVEQLSRCVLGEAVPYVTNEFTMMNARTIDKVLAAMHY